MGIRGNLTSGEMIEQVRSPHVGLCFGAQAYHHLCFTAAVAREQHHSHPQCCVHGHGRAVGQL
jgi:hypothetical protein